MKILLLVIILSFVGSGFGQPKPKPIIIVTEATTKDGKLVILKSDGTWIFSPIQPQPPPVNIFKPKTISNLNAQANKYTIDDFFIRWDEFQDVTTVTTKSFQVLLSNSINLKLNVMFMFKTNTLQVPPTGYILVFQSNSQDWQFLKTAELYILADGQRMNIGEASKDSDVKLGSVTETLFYILTPSQLEKISKSSKVRLQIAIKDGEFSTEALSLMKRLYELASK